MGGKRQYAFWGKQRGASTAVVSYSRSPLIQTAPAYCDGHKFRRALRLVLPHWHSPCPPSRRVRTCFVNLRFDFRAVYMSSASTSERTFQLLYSPTGNESEDRLAFFHILGRLKATGSPPPSLAKTLAHFVWTQTQKRTGWVNRYLYACIVV